MFPIIDLVAMPIPRTLTEIGSDIRAKEPDERTLLLNPILVAIQDQHDEAGERRREARQIIVKHFAMAFGEPQGIVREPGGPSMPAASIVKTLVLESPPPALPG